MTAAISGEVRSKGNALIAIVIHLAEVRHALGEGKLVRAVQSLGIAGQELGAAIERWGNAAPGVEEVRQALIEVENLVMRAVSSRAADRHAVVEVMRAGLRVLRERGFAVGEDVVDERARNIAAAVLGLFDVRVRVEIVPGE